MNRENRIDDDPPHAAATLQAITQTQIMTALCADDDAGRNTAAQRAAEDFSRRRAADRERALARWLDDYQPKTPGEIRLIHHAALLSWQADCLKRYQEAAVLTRFIQTVSAHPNATGDEMERLEALALIDASPAGDRLRRYEAALDREIRRDLADFAKLRGEPVEPKIRARQQRKSETSVIEPIAVPSIEPAVETCMEPAAAALIAGSAAVERRAVQPEPSIKTEAPPILTPTPVTAAVEPTSAPAAISASASVLVAGASEPASAPASSRPELARLVSQIRRIQEIKARETVAQVQAVTPDDPPTPPAPITSAPPLPADLFALPPWRPLDHPSNRFLTTDDDRLDRPGLTGLRVGGWKLADAVVAARPLRGKRR